MTANHSSEAESSEKESIPKGKMCGWKLCSEKATTVEPYKGQLYNLCTRHRRSVRAQKKADNNE